MRFVTQSAGRTSSNRTYGGRPGTDTLFLSSNKLPIFLILSLDV
jgi:TM2 domain-containing membrane protein YozV